MEHVMIHSKEVSEASKIFVSQFNHQMFILPKQRSPLKPLLGSNCLTSPPLHSLANGKVLFSSQVKLMKEKSGNLKHQDREHVGVKCLE